MDFLTLAKKRYACRKYKADKVEPAKLAAILEAGRVAPTGANRQPQRLVVVESKEGMERLARCTRDFGAPCAVIVCADTDQVWTRKYDGKKIGDIDASIVTDHMMLAATSLGLDTLWICMFKPEALREEFHLPDHVEPVNILLLGYGDGEPADPDRHDTMRKPLSETVVTEHF
ncbi:nitroreductase family protein [uncultured Alistipes sp.]|jgi:nitroreductase|uniref:nitroreductase family protein n=1 Tax=uncultured Alistipes sp. TaxID=538949 RepID=UPI0025CD2D09|nr:nitroreductase family protein [uncultured Alistipes sp.]